jgi:hypothetical protein
MKAYLDSTDNFYSLNQETKPKDKKNDRTIGIMSLILVVAFVAYIIWTIIDAYAYGESDFMLEMSNASTVGIMKS